MQNLELMRKRLELQGGVKQDERMIHDKYRAFLKSLQYSYQAADVEKLGEDGNIHRALINPSKVKPDYDDKVISIDYSHNFIPGDIFKWIGTNSYWIIYLREMTEDAYFRGDIRRCQYNIKWKDVDDFKEYSTWAAIRGPVETVITSFQKNQNRVDSPNMSLNILMPNNEANLKAFQRYEKFLFKKRCWQVQTINDISMDGVIEITAQEYYYNSETDDVDNEIANGLVVETIDPNEIDRNIQTSSIQGETFIKPKSQYLYAASGLTGGQWSVESNRPIELIETDDGVLLKWLHLISGQFTLSYSTEEETISKIVVVESLF